MNMLVKCYSSLNVLFNPNDIERAHRIGLSNTDKHSGKKVKFIIVKFRSWKARWRRYHTDGSKKPGFSISVDGTERPYLLLIKAKGFMK